jgi:hypothetical protein
MAKVTDLASKSRLFADDQPQPPTDPATAPKTETTGGSPPPIDPFDNIDLIRSPQNHIATGSARKMLLNVRNSFKPPPGAFVRTHPSPDYQLEAGLVIPPHRKHFLLIGEMREYGKRLPGYVPIKIFTTVDRDGDAFLWMVKCAKDGQEPMAWHETAMEGAIAAQTKWVQCNVDMKNGCYSFLEIQVTLPDPQFPDAKFGELLRVSFKGSIITSSDDIEVRKLEGKA